MERTLGFAMLMGIGIVASVLASPMALASSSIVDRLLVGADEDVVTFTAFAAGAGNTECDLPALHYKGSRTSPTSAYQMTPIKGSPYTKLKELAFAYSLMDSEIRYADQMTYKGHTTITLLGTYQNSTRANTGLWSTADGQCQGSFSIESKRVADL